jgi:hypothetical protein
MGKRTRIARVEIDTVDLKGKSSERSERSNANHDETSDEGKSREYVWKGRRNSIIKKGERTYGYTRRNFAHIRHNAMSEKWK